MLGDSFTEGMLAWRDTYVAQTAGHFPQYDFLNGAVASYSPSNYLNVTRMVLDKGVAIDEVIVFIDISDVSDEAAVYHDTDASGAVIGPRRQSWRYSRHARWCNLLARHLLLTKYLLELLEWRLINWGHYQISWTEPINVFDMQLVGLDLSESR